MSFVYDDEDWLPLLLVRARWVFQTCGLTPLAQVNRNPGREPLRVDALATNPKIVGHMSPAYTLRVTEEYAP